MTAATPLSAASALSELEIEANAMRRACVERFLGDGEHARYRENALRKVRKLSQRHAQIAHDLAIVGMVLSEKVDIDVAFDEVSLRRG